MVSVRLLFQRDQNLNINFILLFLLVFTVKFNKALFLKLKLKKIKLQNFIAKQ